MAEQRGGGGSVPMIVYSCADAGRRLGVSSRRVIQLADAGVLPVLARTASGMRLFDPRNVEALMRQREINGFNDRLATRKAAGRLGGLASQYVQAGHQAEPTGSPA